MKKILVPVDGSEQSIRALNEALSLVEGREADYSLTLVFVSPNPVYYPHYPVGVSGANAALDAEVSEDAKEAAKEEGNKLLESLVNQMNSEEVQVNTVHLNGVPSYEICHYADEENVNMIVMGNRGRGAFGEIILGSVSHKVLHLAKCPVLIVK